MNDDEISMPKVLTAACMSLVIIGALPVGGMVGCPAYNVYYSHKAGEAEFARAEANRQILVQTAQAEQEAATHKAQAEIERAKGVAEANKIIGDSLRDNESYLRYLWVTNLGHGDTIYVPTEANLPILEAGRLLTDSHKQARHRDDQGDIEREIVGDHVHAGHQHAAAVRE